MIGMIARVPVRPGVLACSRTCAVLVLAGCCALGGCRTSKDAAATADQMAQTATALSEYYGAVRAVLEHTDELYELNHDLYGKPYPSETRNKLKDNEAELARRAELAAEFAVLADSFGKLSSSTAAVDAAASAEKLDAAVDGLASVTASSAEQGAVKLAMGSLVKAIQEHKEREAAKDMGDAVKSLRDLFDKEGGIWEAREHLYTGVASNLAEALVDAHATDNLPLLEAALGPFGLHASPAASDLNARLGPAAKNRIEARRADMDSAFERATGDMSGCLHTMADRVDAVAHGKALASHSAPVTAASVRIWASQVAAKRGAED